MYNTNKTQILQNILESKFDEILEKLGIGLNHDWKKYYGCCPIHGGDNIAALNVYNANDNYPYNWRCYTHQCQLFFKRTVLGFIRGVLSHQKYDWTSEVDKNVSLQETIDWSLQNFDLNWNTLEQQTVTKSNKQPPIITANKLEQKQFGRQKVRSLLKIPSEFYVNRGFKKEILDFYDVGFCKTYGKPMYKRTVVPVYDETGRYLVGCAGRAFDDGYKPKWRNSANFRAEKSLYNYWYAKSHIRNKRKVILVEGPPDIWRLQEAGIYNGVALYKVDLSELQKIILEKSGAIKVIIALDNDKAGHEGAERIYQQLKRGFNTEIFRYNHCKDIGECSVEFLKQESILW